MAKEKLHINLFGNLKCNLLGCRQEVKTTDFDSVIPWVRIPPSQPRSVYSKPPRGTDWVTLIAIIILVDVNIDGVRIC